MQTKSLGKLKFTEQTETIFIQAITLHSQKIKGGRIHNV